jgi:hypothetical protein
VHTNSDSNVDDSGYFEFGDSRDDTKEFTGSGGLSFKINGPGGDPEHRPARPSA